MINFKFLKVQLKSTWILLTLFSIATLFMIIPDLIGPKTFSPFSHVYPNGTGSSGSAGLFFSVLVVTGTMALSFILSILLIHKLFIKEIDRSYIGSWLVMPMSKVNVYVTKLGFSPFMYYF